RELTKAHEEKLLMTLSEAVNYYEKNKPRGEFVLVIEGKNREEIKKRERESWKDMSLEEHMAIYEEKGMTKKDAMKAVAKDRGVTKREVYQELL
ncbi:MAG: 16S rRNA (cytidine(1402)-2'-O)-methyltransferase, partial [Clostridium sp.]|nr:16S rRNA (cytidine(1402)-2'-O)-methyltransferase [Clostridium sp.]